MKKVPRSVGIVKKVLIAWRCSQALRGLRAPAIRSPLSRVLFGWRVAKVAAEEAADEALVQQMASGSTEALRAASDRYSRGLTGLAARILGDELDAQEVAADALWQAWRQAGSFETGRGSVAAWLVTITRSRAIDRLRAHKSRHLRTQDETKLASAAAAVPDPALEVGRAERGRAVKKAVAGLQSAERELLELAYFSDLSQSEIAARTGTPLGTVKTRMRSAMIKLRDALKGVRD